MVRQPLGASLVCGAAFTANWDILGVDIAGRTIKPSLVLAGLAVAAWMARGAVRPVPAPRLNRRGLLVAVTVSLLAGWLVARAMFEPFRPAIPAVIAMVTVATYALAVLLHRNHADRILRWFVWGMTTASVLALLQRAGIPGTYSTSQIGAGGHRGVGLAYEPAYFAAGAFAAATIVYLTWRHDRTRTLVLLVLAGGMVSANARAVLVQAAVTLLAYALLGRDRAAKANRRRLMRLGFAGVLLFLTASVVQPSVARGVSSRLASITDRDEAQSNALRIRLYDNVTTVVQEHPWVGVGPGMLAASFREKGYKADLQSQGNDQIVANNLLLQALADGGIIAVALEALLVLAVLRCCRRQPALGAAWAGLVIGAGLTVSNYWDAEPWLLLGLVLAASRRRVSHRARILT